MANLSQLKREKMLAFLEKLKEQHTDDESLIALGEIEKELKLKKYGLVWEEHEEAVDVQMKTQIPVFTEVKEREIYADESGAYNFLLEGDNLHSLYLLEKTHRGKIDVIYIVICSWMVFFIPFHKKFYTYLHLNIKIKMHALRS